MKPYSYINYSHFSKDQFQKIFCRFSRFASNLSCDDWTIFLNSLPFSFQKSPFLLPHQSSICAIRHSLYHPYLPAIGTVFPVRLNLPPLELIVLCKAGLASSKFGINWKRISFLMSGQISSIASLPILIPASTRDDLN